jgi:uncharacterized membrane protein
MIERNATGRFAYALAGIWLGIIGLIWHDFAGVWQPIDNLGLGFNRSIVASIYAAAFLAAGIATLVKKSAWVGLLVLAFLHLLAALGWIPRAISHGVWNGFCEMLSLTIAALVASLQLTPSPTHWRGRSLLVGRMLFAICLLVFGLTHFVASDETARMVPSWLPPGQMFWAYATGVFYVAAAVALATRVRAVLAARLAALMMLGFNVLVWLPMLINKPIHFMWAGNAITFAMAAAAWLMADLISAREESSPE